MSETTAIPSKTLFTPETIQIVSGHRDTALHELLGTDYDFADESGLLNLFYFNPGTGEDGLMHVLGGEYLVGEDGTKRSPRGFHHEPSAEAAWAHDASGKRMEKVTTYVDRSHLERKNPQKRKEFVELPYEPYHARVVIDGLRKITTNRGKNVETNNSMFPKQYDALAVMQTIRIALSTRDTSKDKIDEKNAVVQTEGVAPMLDGKSTMRIRLILDMHSGKVMSAYPVASKQETMNLSRELTKEHLGLVN